MTYVIEPSAFGVGYSIFRVEVIDGERVKRYIADVDSVVEARSLCPDAEDVYSPDGEYSKPWQLNLTCHAA